MACWYWADTDKRFFGFVFQDYAVFHCWKVKQGWDLTINSRTPEVNHRRIYSLCCAVWFVKYGMIMLINANPFAQRTAWATGRALHNRFPTRTRAKLSRSWRSLTNSTRPSMSITTSSWTGTTSLAVRRSIETLNFLLFLQFHLRDTWFTWKVCGFTMDQAPPEGATAAVWRACLWCQARWTLMTHV